MATKRRRGSQEKKEVKRPAVKRAPLPSVDERLNNVIRPEVSLPHELLPDSEEREAQLATEFTSRFADIAREWTELDLLHRILVERRSLLEDVTPIRLAFELLSAKAFSDSRAAFVLIQRGYTLASLGPLRAANDSIDLLKLFHFFPGEVKGWILEEPGFRDFAWIRKKLSAKEQQDTIFHRFLSRGMHANWRFILPFMGQRTHAADTRVLLVPGPLHTEWTEFAAAFSYLRRRERLRYCMIKIRPRLPTSGGLKCSR